LFGVFAPGMTRPLCFPLSLSHGFFYYYFESVLLSAIDGGIVMGWVGPHALAFLEWDGWDGMRAWALAGLDYSTYGWWLEYNEEIRNGCNIPTSRRFFVGE
jgi:hypothetical protein